MQQEKEGLGLYDLAKLIENRQSTALQVRLKVQQHCSKLICKSLNNVSAFSFI
jgi:hypothetical protein